MKVCHINDNFVIMIVKNIILSLIATISVSMIIVACNGSRNAGTKGGLPVVAVSIPPQQFFVDNIAGNRVETVCLLGGSSDPESFEPSIRQFVELEKSRVYIQTGAFAFERAIAERLKSNRSDLKIVNATKGVDVLYDTHGHSHSHDGVGHEDHGHHHHHGEADPHMWSSAVNAKIIALNTLEALIEADSRNEDVYRSNYARLEARLDSVDSCFRRLFENMDERPSFAVWHPSLSYFARDYGLRQISLVDAGKESSVKSLAESMKMIAGDDCRVYFYQSEFDSEKVADFVRDSGIEVVTINPMSREWEDEMQKLYEAFSNH